jgi:type II secretory pathway pseudopilin PulG
MPIPRTNAEMEIAEIKESQIHRQRFALPLRSLCIGDSSNEKAFTLIELLVVITIIIALLGMLFPVYNGIQDRARKVQARNDLTQIVTAVNAYYTEYGKYPIATNDIPFANTGDLFYTLRAIPSGANASDAANPRRIVFITPPDAKDQASPRSGIKMADGQWYDPWGTTYKVAIDGDYDNQLAQNPYTNGAGASPLSQTVIAWSLGKDVQLGTRGNSIFTGSDDVISWQ